MDDKYPLVEVLLLDFRDAQDPPRKSVGRLDSASRINGMKDASQARPEHQ